MKTAVVSTALFAGAAYAHVAAYGQCGGQNFTGNSTTCVSGYTCKYQNPYYSQCVLGTASLPATTFSTARKPATATAVRAVVASSDTVAVAYAQCGGENFSGPTTCASGYTCTSQNPYYSQCVPGSATTATTLAKDTTTEPVASTKATSAKLETSTPESVATSSAAPEVETSAAVIVSTSAAAVKASASASVAKVETSASPIASTVAKTETTSSAVSSASTASASGKVKFAGINISGFDFGCSTDGTCTSSSMEAPLKASSGVDGIGQMQHFVSDDNLNVFRLPIGWQYLQTSLGATLDATNLALYDELVQGCLATGAYCVIDIHNYARWNGAIIGQGGPTNAEFANLWSQIATKYASESSIIFGVMNEPHDVDINEWATSVQAAVTAIRTAGATTQYVLLPGNNYASAEEFISNGSGAALLNVTNLDGTTKDLIFDVHQYLDSDNSGTNAECVTNNIDSAFEPLAAWLRTEGRMAFNTESGGGNVASCETYLCQEYAYLDENSDVFLGRIGWAAGAFATSYVLSETPTLSGTTWTDTALVSACIAR